MNTTHKSIVVVTGGQMGLGYEAALVIANDSPDRLVIIASRSSGEQAAQKINEETGNANVRYHKLDLADLNHVRRFASEILAYGLPVGALVLNAGIQTMNLSYTTDGIETTFGVNHVGHALLFYLLQPHFDDNARVVITSSGTHDPAQKTGIPAPKYVNAELLAHPDQVSMSYPERQRYSTSKFCNVMWMYALDRHRKSKGLSFTVTAMDPGMMPGTGLARDANSLERFLWHHLLPRIVPLLRLLFPNTQTPQESGQALARLAISPEVENVSGTYFEGVKPIQSSQDSYDERKQEDLWEWTAKFLGRSNEEVEAYQQLSNQGTNA